MSIRNATIAMRKRKIELFEQERIALRDYGVQRQGGIPNKNKKNEDTYSRKAAKTFRWDS